MVKIKPFYRQLISLEFLLKYYAAAHTDEMNKIAGMGKHELTKWLQYRDGTMEDYQHRAKLDFQHRGTMQMSILTN